MIELLAPAKDKTCAIAAIDYGADAIYIGASDFGARKNVPNSIEDIKEIVKYAHKFNVKVYVTINTILTDDEIIKARELISKLKAIGIDAIIIQDMGLVDMQKHLPIHASTQCDNRTPEKVKFLEDVGFSRVILARELSIEQIKEIRKQTSVELECFIHGALCVSYSGQCYLSQLIGGKQGRSSNRGECAQPCRKRYSLIDEDGNFIAKNKYLLNLKDFNATEHLKELANAGVTSFKIEGRLKDVSYIKNVVAFYRKKIDELGLGKTSSGKILFDFEPDLNKSFNRGFTDYFLKKRTDCFSLDTPKTKGEYIGKVSKVNKDSFEITPSTQPVSPLAPQDGLCFFENGILCGCLVNKIEKNKIHPNKINGIKVGAEIYRNYDAEFEKKLKNSKTCRKIVANIEFGIGKIKATDENKNSVEIKYEFEELAQNEEKMSENIINQFKKSGESDFLIKEVKIETKKIPFLPVSKLNEIRRKLLEDMAKERLKNYTSTHQSPQNINPPSPYPQNEVDYRGNILNKSAKEFYEGHSCKATEWALESGKVSKSSKCAMTTKHCLKHAFNMCKSTKKLYLIDEKGKKYDLKFGCDNNGDKCEMEIYF